MFTESYILSNFVRRYCWLINRTGKRDGFLPIDLGQEQNIRDIKVTWRSFGPGVTMKYIQKVSPAIPILRAVRDTVHTQFSAILGRGTRHQAPSKDKDVAHLMEMYLASKVHQYSPGLTFKAPADISKDIITTGGEKLSADGLFERWWADRNISHSQEEIYSLSNDEQMQVDS